MDREGKAGAGELVVEEGMVENECARLAVKVELQAPLVQKGELDHVSLGLTGAAVGQVVLVGEDDLDRA